MQINSEITDYYNSGIEKDRLSIDTFQLEKVRTQEIILRYLPNTPVKILDVGAGAGFYSFWLKEMGHEVHFIDAVKTNVDNALAYTEKSGITLDSLNIGDARSLDFEENTIDCVLMFGPLYHLTEKKDRLQALREAKRVLVPGGKLLSVGISKYASVLDGFSRNLVADKEFVGIMKQDIATGQHRNTTGNSEYFTTAFFHHPEELKNEIVESQLRCNKLIPIESFGWLVPEFEEKWKDNEFQEQLLGTIRRIESDPSLFGISAHIMAVAEKPH